MDHDLQLIDPYDNSQNWHEDAAGYCGAESPDGHDEVDEERGETDVVVEDVVSVSRPQPGQVRRTTALNQRSHCNVTHGDVFLLQQNSNCSIRVMSQEFLREFLY